MKKDASKNNLQELLKDVQQTLFIQSEEDLNSFNICKVSGDTLFVEVPIDKSFKKDIHGFMVSEDQCNVFEFSGLIESDTPSSKTKRMLQIVPNQKTIQRINRRIAPRVLLEPPISVTVNHPATGDTLQAHIMNLGVGGLCLQTDKDIKINDMFIFSFELECDGIVHRFSIPGTVVSKIPFSLRNAYNVKFVRKSGGAGERPRDLTADILKLSSLIVRLSMQFSK
jgi:hypothetical protein